MDANTSVVRIRAQRTVARRALTRYRQELQNLLDNDGTSTDIQSACALLAEKLERLKVIDEQYLNAAGDLEENVFEEELERIEEYNDAAQRLLHRAKIKLSDKTSSSAGAASTADSDSDASSLKSAGVTLPQLELPTFDGDPMKWRPFWDQFRAAVDTSTVPEVKKLMYLTSRLRGPARDAVDGIPITAANYESVVNELHRRFGNPNMLIGLHADRLVSVSCVDDSDTRSFRRLIDTFDRSLREIEQLITEDNGLGSLHDLLLAPLLLQKIPAATRIEWNRRNPNSLQRFDLTNLRQFIRCEVETLESLSSKSHHDDRPTRPKHRSSATSTPPIKSTTAALTTNQRPTPIYNLPVNERLQAVKLQRLCLNCLKPGHRQAECRSKFNCRTCHRRHHTCLHDCYTRSTSDPSNITDSPTHSVDPSSSTAVNLGSSSPATVTHRILLQTAVVNVTSQGNQSTRARVLIDSGSEFSYVTRKLSTSLQAASIEHRPFVIEGFGGHKSSLADRDRVLLRLANRNDPSSSILCKLWVIESICNPLRGPKVNLNCLPPAISDLDLADDYADSDLDIDLILGADCMHALFLTAPPVVSEGISAWKTRFDWVISGRLKSSDQTTFVQYATTACLRSTTSPDQLWDLEHIGIRPPATTDQCLPPPRWTSGRYEVSLPWIDSTRPALTFHQAQTRLKQFFRLPPNLQQKYRDVFIEWTDLGVIEPSTATNGNFLPHHGVLQGEKMRVVVDASASPWKGSCLNDLLHPGPAISLDLVSVLLRFRHHSYVLSSDIQRAFLTIGIDQPDRQFLKVLLPSGQPYQFTSLPFGLNCSPAVLHNVIQHHLRNESSETLARTLLDGLYVDDLVIGAESTAELSCLKDTAQNLFSRAGMNLRKFATSEVNLKEEWCPDLREVKILGILWNLQTDTISINVPQIEKNVTTRRGLLSVAARTFDPLGLLSPWCIRFRFLVQETWRTGGGMDDPLSSEVIRSTNLLLEELEELSQISFPRRISDLSYLDWKDYSLLLFVDASERAYAACLYLRSPIHDTRLIFSRVRLAPLKRRLLTLPRLELMAAVLGSRILTHVRDVIPQMKSLPYHCFSDSMIVLGWIQNDSTDLFVRNRVREIRNNTSSRSWQHIPTKSNPADLPTRGSTAEQLSSSSLWWNGPPQLPQTSTALRTITHRSTSAFLPVNRWSSWRKACRVVAFVLRFTRNCRSSPSERLTSTLSVDEIYSAASVLIKDSQSDIDPSGCDPKFQLHSDDNGVLLSRLRTNEDPLPYVDVKSSIFPLLVKDIHVRLYHQGLNSTITEYSRSYVTPRLRQNAKKILSSCIPCRKINSRPFRSEEGPLPDFRSSEARAFDRTGIDHCGPLYVRDKSKVWILLFTCAVTRAVHLEVVNSLNETHTSLAIRRFMAIRGRVTTFYSDNGTSFTCLRKLLKGEVKWSLIPVRAPWWGGFWERMVGTVKRALLATLSRASLSLIELQTVVAECAERINRRPLCVINEDSLEPLTPAHFIYGCSPPALADRSIASDLSSDNLGHRWRHRLNVSDLLWRRWRREYLPVLRTWRQPTKNAIPPSTGDIVLVDMKPHPRSRWPIGKITAIHHGRDGKARAADVLCKGHTSRRSITQLHPLEAK